MDAEAHFRSLTAELEALKDRIRNFIHDGHWPTDGEWKESVLRTALRRSAADNITIGRGFVVTKDWASSQIDVLVYDNTLPVLYRDGDLVFVTPQACRAIIEVKTSCTRRALEEAASKVADIAQVVHPIGNGYIFTGVFVYERGRRELNDVPTLLNEVAQGDDWRIIDSVVIGPSSLTKYWVWQPGEPAHRRSGFYNTWHQYVIDGQAPGFFMHTLLMRAKPDPAGHLTWFPEDGMESFVMSAETFVRRAEQA